MAVYAFFDVRATAHDMFVSGGTFTRLEAPEAEPCVSEAGLGMHLRIWGTRITMATNHQSRTFVGQTRSHVYGTLGIVQDLGHRRSLGAP
jgi:hypothetical protein